MVPNSPISWEKPRKLAVVCADNPEPTPNSSANVHTPATDSCDSDTARPSSSGSALISFSSAPGRGAAAPPAACSRCAAITRVSGSFHQISTRHKTCTATIAAYGSTIGYISRRTGLVLIMMNTNTMYQVVIRPKARSLLLA